MSDTNLPMDDLSKLSAAVGAARNAGAIRDRDFFAAECVSLRARVTELEANNEGSLKAAAYWKENWQRSEAHAATLREALEEAAAHMWGNQKRCGCLNECIHTGEVVRAALAATPAASLAAHDCCPLDDHRILASGGKEATR